MTKQLTKRFIFSFVILMLLLGMYGEGQAAPPAQEPAPAAVFESMKKQAGDNLEIYWDEDTGVPRFLLGQVPSDMSVASDGESKARAFFHSYADLYQMKNPATELAVIERSRDEQGMEHTRFRQEVDGIPVWGAVMVVHTNSGGQITAVNGEYIPNISLNVTPDLSLAEGLALVKHDLGDNEAEFRAKRSELVVYARHKHTPTLTWKINVFSHNPLGNWFYFIDAHSGDIVYRLNQLDTAKSLDTYDANNGTTLPGTSACTNNDGTCPAGDASEQAAHQNAGIVYDYYLNTFGRDSYDNGGATLISSVHYSSLYNNAFWNSTQMVYGDGDGVTFGSFAQALDIVGHELTHAVTENEAGLIYEDQSGALNESYSDVFGTLVEFYGDPGNADWLSAEDIYTPGTPGDAGRDLSNPSGGAAGTWNPVTPFGGAQPDHMSIFAALPLVLDSGGVHINSGIPNKAAYLIAQGGSFYGVTVTGIGRSAMGAIYYRTLTQYLTPTSNFMDARNASIQACIDLYGNGHANCDSVQNGFTAVGIGASTTPPNSTIYLPVIMKKDFGCNNPTGIYGQVANGSVAASGVSLSLRACTSGGCFTHITTTTDSNGCYNFIGASSLPSNYYYYVRYLNSSSTYNNRLYLWSADRISSYTAGANTYGGNFDLADVVLVSPGSSSAAPLPMTFSWNIRNSSEMYKWELYDYFDGNPYASLGPEYGRSSYTLTSLPSGFSTYTLYGWDALVYTADGYGVPYYYNYVKFSSYTLLPEFPSTQQETRVPAWQVRNADDFEARE